MGEKEEGPYRHFARPTAPRTQGEKPNSNKHWGVVMTTIIVILLILIPVAHYFGSQHYGQRAQEVERVKKNASLKHSSSVNKKLKLKNSAKASKKNKPARQKKAGAVKTYVVKNGDTLSGIAAKTGLSVSRLTSLNNITDTSDIKIGQTLKLN